MLLALDVGNSNLTLGLFRHRSLAGSRRARTALSTPDELEVLLDGLLALEGVSLRSVVAIALASVVPALTASVRAVADRRSVPLVIAGPSTIGIPIRVDRPAEVGADRLVNALAAQVLHGSPAVVLDLGTATTTDVVASDGGYCGGAIAPGVELGIEALAGRTAQLPRVPLETPLHVIGRNTVEAIQAGAVTGHQLLAAGLLARSRAELAAAEGLSPAAVRTVLTGGYSNADWARQIAGVDVVDPDLTLRGLAILHERWAELAGGSGDDAAPRAAALP